ncbi:conserved Plasmodium protein, unknown function [Plasmodium relictum]|uniref:Uncharacterized protein n=1 Tax=Plasmodium relictum TaxID=85471 RepID=A0A1J1H3J1_PLARL|nr:conserved Plasmodium protein, unknown function [Plasmodium relictum]CRG99462.1 conserved Plasmodium protein, unknown function [Plasmodium relictum]
MEKSNSSSSGVIVSIIFYICYLFYFITYSYEIVLVFSKDIDYVMFCALLVTSMFSIFFVSMGLMYTSFFLVAIISLTEIYEYTGNLLEYVLDDEFNKLFLLVRLFTTVNFIVFFSMHISNLKKKKKEYLNKIKSQNSGMQLHNKMRPSNNSVLRNNSGPISKNIHNENRRPLNQENLFPSQTITPDGCVLTSFPNDKNALTSQHNVYNSQYMPSNHYNIKSPHNLNTIENNQILNNYSTVNHNLDLQNDQYINPMINSNNLNLYKNNTNTCIQPIQPNKSYLIKGEYNTKNNCYEIPNSSPRNDNNFPPFIPNNILIKNASYPNTESINKNNGSYNAYNC